MSLEIVDGWLIDTASPLNSYRPERLVSLEDLRRVLAEAGYAMVELPQPDPVEEGVTTHPRWTSGRWEVTANNSGSDPFTITLNRNGRGHSMGTHRAEQIARMLLAGVLLVDGTQGDPEVPDVP